MQFRTVLCSALFAGANAVSAQAEVKARVWMLDHPGSNPDELSDLKTENPDAYALVKALLTKRSLGLLDPRHPTASFAKQAPHDDNEDHGAAMYAKFATTEKDKEALEGVSSSSSDPYPEAPAQAAVPYPEAAGAKKDWLSWKPKDSGADDDAMVKNVLGAVADLTKGKNNLRGAAPAEENPLEAEAASQMDAESAPQQVVTTTVAATQAPTNENPYLKVMEPAAPEPAAPKVAAEPEPRAGNALASFSWDDSQTTTVTTTAAPKGSKGGGNPLASWLGLVKPHVQTAAPQAEKPSNPYLMDLQ